MSHPQLSSGVPGLDRVLHGGYLRGQSYLVRGGPGCGKTTLGLQFLYGGLEAGVPVLFITLGEPADQIRRNADTLGFDGAALTILDLSPAPDSFLRADTYDLFSPGEVEHEPLVEAIEAAIAAGQPQRVFVDSMTQFRYLMPNAFQFRKQAVAFLRYLSHNGATTLFTSEDSPEAPDADLQFLCDGILTLDFRLRERTLTVAKFRGSDFLRGVHPIQLGDRGLALMPSLETDPSEIAGTLAPLKVLSMGVVEMDEMLQGGLERSTITILTGPSGVGKTTLALQFIKEAAGRGERSVVYLLEEEPATLSRRCEAVNIPIGAMVERGTLELIAIEPLRYTPDEFAQLVCRDVEQRDTKIVAIDSLAGYRLSFSQGDMARHLHALCRYLKSHGVTTVLINEMETITGDFQATGLSISYLADNIIFLRFIEIRGELRKAIGVLKKRLSDFEKTLREFEITRYGLKVGRPLSNLRGILSGTPDVLD